MVNDLSSNVAWLGTIHRPSHDFAAELHCVLASDADDPFLVVSVYSLYKISPKHLNTALSPSPSAGDALLPSRVHLQPIP